MRSASTCSTRASGWSPAAGIRHCHGRLNPFVSHNSNNCPTYPFLHPSRGTDVIINFDASSDVQSEAAAARNQEMGDMKGRSGLSCTLEPVGCRALIRRSTACPCYRPEVYEARSPLSEGRARRADSSAGARRLVQRCRSRWRRIAAARSSVQSNVNIDSSPRLGRTWDRLEHDHWRSVSIRHGQGRRAAIQSWRAYRPID
jgi:hypothetical protein